MWLYPYLLRGGGVDVAISVPATRGGVDVAISVPATRGGGVDVAISVPATRGGGRCGYIRTCYAGGSNVGMGIAHLANDTHMLLSRSISKLCACFYSIKCPS